MTSAFNSDALSAEEHKITYEMIDDLYALLPDELRREELVLIMRRMALPEMQALLRTWERDHKISS